LAVTWPKRLSVVPPKLPPEVLRRARLDLLAGPAPVVAGFPHYDTYGKWPVAFPFLVAGMAKAAKPKPHPTVMRRTQLESRDAPVIAAEVKRPAAWSAWPTAVLSDGQMLELRWHAAGSPRGVAAALPAPAAAGLPAAGPHPCLLTRAAQEGLRRAGQPADTAKAQPGPKVPAPPLTATGPHPRLLEGAVREALQRTKRPAGTTREQAGEPRGPPPKLRAPPPGPPLWKP